MFEKAWILRLTFFITCSQASMLKVEHIREVRTLQAKFKTSEEDYLKSIDGLRKKNQELLRKVAQLSKGKL